MTATSYVTSYSIAIDSAHNTTTATFKLTIPSGKCITITFASYAAPAASFQLPQTLREYKTQKYTYADTVHNGTRKTLTLGPIVVDPCFYQVDLAVGDVITNLSSTNLYGSRLVTANNGGVKCNSHLITSASPTTSLPVGSGAISDSAILSGLSAYYLNAGTLTFKLYGPEANSTTCSTLIHTTTVNVTSGNGTYPDPWTYTPTAVGGGYYNWLVSYSGSDQNTAVTGSCGGSSESVHVVKSTPTLSTQASDPVTLGSGAAIHDTATLGGGYSPAGSITFKLYANSACTGSDVYHHTASVSGDGMYGSGDYVPSAAGTYYWSASYSGDGNNVPLGPTSCPDPSESVTVSPSGPSLVTHVASGTVSFNSPVSDTATLSGGTSPTGTIHFALYGPNDPSCSGSAVYSHDVTVSGNGAYGSGNSNPITASGTYEWAVKYTSADGNNTSVDLGCGGGDEVVQVGEQDRTPPQCALYQIINGPPKIIEVALQDAGGLASIEVTAQTNADITIPDVSSHPTGQVILTAQRHDPSKGGSFALKVTDTSGNVTVCDPSLPASARHKAVTSASARASAGGLSLKADSRLIAYGADHGVTLSGSIPNARPGQKVTLLTQGCGFTTMAAAHTALTGTGGAFRFNLTPVLTTSFAVQWGGRTTKIVRVVVRPDVALTRESAGLYRIDVSTTNGVFLAGTRVVLQRLAGKHWVPVTSAALAKNSSEEAMTAVSTAVVAANTYGSRLRVVVPATACYAPGASGVITG
ncbi:MAG: hypothetical protein ACRDL2_11825 [Gaiellaceae bacterium]